jgi:soluble lytic murein transglycosylase
MALLLSILMAVPPVAGQTSDEPAAMHPHASASKGKTAVAKGKTAAGNTARKSSRAKTSANKPTAKSRKHVSRASKASSADDSATSDAHATASKGKSAAAKSRKPASRARRASRAANAARTARIKQAFVASTELRPMAQQLASMRTPEAYAGVTAYARRHSGEAAATAYLALGHAYLLDRRYTEAEASLRLARQTGQELADYADFLNAQALHSSGDDAAAETLLRGFSDRYPDSIFNVEAPELEANVLLATNDAAGAQQVLAKAAGLAAEDRTGFQLAQGQVEYALGQKEAAARTFKQLLLTHPLAQDAQVARARLTQMGVEATLTPSELRGLADAYYKGGRYGEAAEQYRALLRMPGLNDADFSGFAVAAAACDLKLKRLTTAAAQALADTPDENGARRLYLLMELARDRDDMATQQSIVTDMESRFPASPWLAEALYSSGNMYLLKRDYPRAVEYYGYLAVHFPSSKNASAAHWKAGWLNYRQGLYADAARLFDEQIKLYPTAPETVGALYWRGRLYEAQDHAPARAAANYRAIVRVYQHYFYAQMSRARLVALGDMQPAPVPQLDILQPVTPPVLVDSFPAESPQLAGARLLANAGLNEYIAREIAADPDSSSWSALAEAQIYSSYGETFRAMRAMKRALPTAASAPIKAVPLAYWRILFPEPWWDIIKAESAKNNLDPYLVASLIRQESEFNPSVVSYANAWGLMQLLPPVGKALAKEEGMSHFQTFQLLDPETNIRLGTRYLRQRIERFGGVPEYALAAYNAGDSRVVDWEAAGPYQGMDEFVESIPFTQTREYVEAILRNVETYRAIDELARSQVEAKSAAAK